MKNLKKVLALLLVISLMASFAVAANAAKFTDIKVTAGDVNSEEIEIAVDVLSELGIIKGYEDGTFKPENNITRAEFDAVVYRLITADVDTATLTSPTKFSDVKATDWFSGYVNYTATLNPIVINGYPDGTFKPQNNVTKAEAATMVVRSLGYKAETTENGLYSAFRLGIVDNIIDAKAPATRADVAVMLYRALTCPYVRGIGWYDDIAADIPLGVSTVLTAVFKINARPVVLTYNKVGSYVELATKNTAGAFAVNGTYYQYTKDVTGLLGHLVDAYITANGRLLIITKNANSTVISGEALDFDPVTVVPSGKDKVTGADLPAQQIDPDNMFKYDSLIYKYSPNLHVYVAGKDVTNIATITEVDWETFMGRANDATYTAFSHNDNDIIDVLFVNFSIPAIIPIKGVEPIPNNLHFAAIDTAPVDITTVTWSRSWNNIIYGTGISKLFIDGGLVINDVTKTQFNKFSDFKLNDITKNDVAKFELYVNVTASYDKERDVYTYDVSKGIVEYGKSTYVKYGDGGSITLDGKTFDMINGLYLHNFNGRTYGAGAFWDAISSFKPLNILGFKLYLNSEKKVWLIREATAEELNVLSQKSNVLMISRLAPVPSLITGTQFETTVLAETINQNGVVSSLATTAKAIGDADYVGISNLIEIAIEPKYTTANLLDPSSAPVVYSKDASTGDVKFVPNGVLNTINTAPVPALAPDNVYSYNAVTKELLVKGYSFGSTTGRYTLSEGTVIFSITDRADKTIIEVKTIENLASFQDKVVTQMRLYYGTTVVDVLVVYTNKTTETAEWFYGIRKDSFVEYNADGTIKEARHTILTQDGKDEVYQQEIFDSAVYGSASGSLTLPERIRNFDFTDVIIAPDWGMARGGWNLVKYMLVDGVIYGFSSADGHTALFDVAGGWQNVYVTAYGTDPTNSDKLTIGYLDITTMMGEKAVIDEKTNYVAIKTKFDPSWIVDGVDTFEFGRSLEYDITTNLTNINDFDDAEVTDFFYQEGYIKVVDGRIETIFLFDKDYALWNNPYSMGAVTVTADPIQLTYSAGDKIDLTGFAFTTYANGMRFDAAFDGTVEEWGRFKSVGENSIFAKAVQDSTIVHNATDRCAYVGASVVPGTYTITIELSFGAGTPSSYDVVITVV